MGATCQTTLNQHRSRMQLVSVVAGLIAMSNISQGSVATHVQCDGISDNSVTSNFFLISAVKNL